MFIHLSVSGKSSSMQLWFYVQIRHSLRSHLAELTLWVYPDSSTIAARTVPKDFKALRMCVDWYASAIIRYFRKKKRDVIGNAQ